MRSIVVNSVTVNQEGRDDARFFLPRSFDQSKHPEINWCPLSKLADVVHSIVNPEKKPTVVFNCISVKDIDEKEGRIKDIHQLPGSKIKGTRTRALPGEVLFARIEPSIYNKKSAIVPENVDALDGSTEFIVLRPKKGVSPRYLLWVLRSDFITEQLTEDVMRGSTGRRRLDERDFKKMLIPDVSSNNQREIEETILSAYISRDKKLAEAEAVMKDCDKQVVEMIRASEVFEQEDWSLQTTQQKL